MNYKFNIHGISCKSCIEKISSLLTNKLNAANIKFGTNNTIMEFESMVATNVGQLNSLLPTIGDYKVSQFDNNTTSMHTHTKEEKPSYKPIYIIFAYLIAINIIITVKTMQLTEFMPNFMASFFLVFSFFKLLDLEGFAGGYSSYDIIARKLYHYGYIYPFLELGFGITYLLIPHNLYFNVAVLIVMLISSIGVIKAKFSKEQFYCACVGTFLKVPLGSIAIIEDILMTLMALAMILQIIL